MPSHHREIRVLCDWWTWDLYITLFVKIEDTVSSVRASSTFKHAYLSNSAACFFKAQLRKVSVHGSRACTYLSSQSTILYSAFPYILKSFCQVKGILWFHLSIFCSPLFSVFSVFPSFEMHSVFTPFIYSLMFYVFLVHTRIFFKSFFQFTTCFYTCYLL